MSAPRILITGSTDGIGLATAKDLARRGAWVIVHGRNAGKVERARRTVLVSVPGADVEAVIGDFSSLAEVRAMAKDLLNRFDRLDVLINNAGLVLKKREVSQDGYELTLAVNYLAPFLLTNLLIDLIRHSAPARIINVSSSVHSSGAINFDDLQMTHRYSGWQAYCNSKLANVMFTRALARRLDPRVATANALHPGVIATKVLHKNYSGGAPVSEGAKTPVYLAVSPDVAHVTGRFFSSGREVEVTTAGDMWEEERLWETSAALVGL